MGQKYKTTTVSRTLKNSKRAKGTAYKKSTKRKR